VAERQLRFRPTFGGARCERPELKILYTSGQAVTDGMLALFVKNSAFLPKPYTVEQLGTMLCHEI
jgi:hypothetical protein